MKQSLKLASLPLFAGLVAMAVPASAQGPTGTRVNVPSEIITVIGAIRDPDAPAPAVDEAADRDLPELPVAFEEDTANES